MPELDRLERHGEPIFTEDEKHDEVMNAIDTLEGLGSNPNVYDLPTGKPFEPYARAAETFLSAYKKEDPDAMDNEHLKKIAEEISAAASMMSKEKAS